MQSNDPPTTEADGSTRRRTSHLKDVPPSLEMRESIRQRCADVASRMDQAKPLTKDEMEEVARELLREADLPEGYLGWVMVMLSSEYWRDALSAVPPSRRLFLLPHCLKHAEGCPAQYDQFGLNCKECGACSIADYRGLAEELGYRVLVAEGSPVVMKIIIGGYVDAVVGVACLNVLEKAIDKVLLAGIPCMAVPLLSSDCRNTKVDPAWVNEMIRTPYVPAQAKAKSYVHLLRSAASLFDVESLERLAPRVRGTAGGEDASEVIAGDSIVATERIGYEFLRHGGKHSRPFITLAAFDAMVGGDCTGNQGVEHSADLPILVQQAAASMETFHKASLVHDDIEDDDGVRYGRPTVHRQYGLPTAINVGDYLIGLGYRLLSTPPEAGQTQSTEMSLAQIDVLGNLSSAHMRLAEGQGAELLWRDRRNRQLLPIDAMKIYALKTSPAFEAALYSGIRLGLADPRCKSFGEGDGAAQIERYRDAIRVFSRNLGVAFQILNDIGDHYGDEDNKGTPAGDLLGGRPTLLWALAIKSSTPEDRKKLLSLVDDPSLSNAEKIRIGRELFDRADVIGTAMRLVDKHQSRAEKVADDLDIDPLRRLLYFLIDTVLERPTIPTAKTPAVVSIGLSVSAS